MVQDHRLASSIGGVIFALMIIVFSIVYYKDWKIFYSIGIILGLAMLGISIFYLYKTYRDKEHFETKPSRFDETCDTFAHKTCIHQESTPEHIGCINSSRAYCQDLKN